MAVTVTTPAKYTGLTTLARLKEELAITTAESDSLLEATIRRSSAAIEAYCHRTFAREAVSETLGGFGGPYLMLNRYPVVSVSTVTFDGELWMDYSLHDKATGTLYRENGWAWTARTHYGLTGGGRFADYGSPIPGSEEPLLVVAYTAGWMLPGNSLINKITVSAASADNSFNDSASGFPALLKAGDIIETSGFANAANNGRHVVSGTPTAAKIVVTTTLTTEAAGASVKVLTENLPADLEKACLESTKTFYLGRQTDPGVVEKQVGPMRVRYGESDSVQRLGLPPSVVGLLAPYVRRA